MKTFAAAAAIALALAACSKLPEPPSFQNTDITGIDYARGFRLTDQDGKVRTLADFKGKVVAVFFGYTQCPDVCPTTMAELSNVKKQLGAQARDFQVVFITLDPQRDTQALLKQYVPAFDPSFIGLRGDDAATAAVARDFKVFYQKVPPKSGDNYTIDHTSGTYVFDKEGKVRLFIRPGQDSASIVHDIKQLLG